MFDILLHLKYKTDEQIFDANIIDNIIFNDRTHLVTQFKDYLIRGDYSEFLSKYNLLNESKLLLKKLIEFYQEYSLLFPNYVILPESQYIYKNIQKNNNASKEEEIKLKALNRSLEEREINKIIKSLDKSRSSRHKQTFPNFNKNKSEEKLQNNDNKSKLSVQQREQNKGKAKNKAQQKSKSPRKQRRKAEGRRNKERGRKQK